MNELSGLGKSLILIGAVIFVIGLLLTFSDKVPFLGKLPGDITFKKGNVKIYTKRLDIAQKAAREGKHVVVLKEKPHIFGTPQL